MEIIDIVWLVSIVGGAGYLLYRSFWKKKGCSSCSGCSCSQDPAQKS